MIKLFWVMVMIKKYVDFDGVVIDSEIHLFDEDYISLKDRKIITNEYEKIIYIQNKNWEKILSKSEIINNAIEILRMVKDDVSILTKIHSMENEGTAKVRLLRSLGIENDIILCPYTLKKTDVVDPRGNILIDDTIHNLDDWALGGGIPIYFNKDNSDIDGWNRENKLYVKTKSLDFLIKR